VSSLNGDALPLNVSGGVAFPELLSEFDGRSVKYDVVRCAISVCESAIFNTSWLIMTCLSTHLIGASELVPHFPIIHDGAACNIASGAMISRVLRAIRMEFSLPISEVLSH
jgi:hypothetical protein